MKKGFRYVVGKSLLPLLLRLLSATWRYEEENSDEISEVLAGTEPAIIAFLHGQMIPIWYRFRGGKFAAIVSASRDGELLTQYLTRGLKYREVIRGSSSKGGRRAFLDIIKALEHQACLITPDGPRGPRGEPKVGAIAAAQRTGKRIVVVTWKAKRTWDLNTWDRISFPYPFSKVNIRYCTIKFQNSNEKPTRIELDQFKKLLNTS